MDARRLQERIEAQQSLALAQLEPVQTVTFADDELAPNEFLAGFYMQPIPGRVDFAQQWSRTIAEHALAAHFDPGDPPLGAGRWLLSRVLRSGHEREIAEEDAGGEPSGPSGFRDRQAVHYVCRVGDMFEPEVL